MFNARFNNFESVLISNCTELNFHYHGEDYYDTPNCRQ